MIEEIIDYLTNNNFINGVDAVTIAKHIADRHEAECKSREREAERKFARWVYVEKTGSVRIKGSTVPLHDLLKIYQQEKEPGI